MLRMLCAIKKVCLIIDDVHWMDDDSWIIFKAVTKVIIFVIPT
jgi:predicted ATPase